MAFVHRKLWSFKPKQYGPWKVVHRSLFLNAERAGIDPATIELAMPMWNSGDQRDYSKNNTGSTNTATFKNNELDFDSTSKKIVLDTTTDYTQLTAIFTAKQDTSDSDGMVFGSHTGTQDFIWLAGGTYFAARWSNTTVPFTNMGSDFTSLSNYVYTGAGNSHKVFRDGSLVDESIITVTDITIGAVGAGYNNLFQLALDGVMKNAILIDKVIDVDISALLSDNPYALWQPSPQTTYFLPQESGASADLTGTAITEGVTESEIVTGGETIIITLTGDTWVATVGADNAITDALIIGITSAQSETNGWNNVVRANMVFGDVARTSDTIVTITLAAEVTYSITANETITITIPATALTAAGAVVATPTFDVTNEGVGEIVQISNASLLYTGQDLGLNASEILSINSSSLLYTGQDLGINAEELLLLGVSSILYTGQGLKINEVIILDSAGMVYTGQALVASTGEVVALVNAQQNYTGQNFKVNETIIIENASMLYQGRSITVTDGTITVGGKRKWVTIYAKRR